MELIIPNVSGLTGGIAAPLVAGSIGTIAGIPAIAALATAPGAVNIASIGKFKLSHMSMLFRQLLLGLYLAQLAEA